MTIKEIQQSTVLEGMNIKEERDFYGKRGKATK